jgi:pyridoxal phosphate enzyme (YggS family)
VESLSESLARVRERIERAAARCRRSPGEITLLAVTKVFPASVIRAAYEQGLREFGENYVQEFEGKEPEVRDLSGARFHLIGHLQSNKSRRAAELFQVIQTIDTPKLAQRLNETGRPLEVMIEVKTSDEASKRGVLEADLPSVVDATRACTNLTLTGLMTVPEWTDVAERSRPAFARLRELAARHSLPKLSMGMSHDFEVAIEEGSTLVRVGTALFGSRRKL